MKTDKERILDALRKGPLTSYEARILGLSGNPSQRCRELIADGHEIAIQHTHREVHGKKRPLAVYMLVREATPHADRAGGAADVNTGTSASPNLFDPEIAPTLFDTAPERAAA